MSSCLRPEGWKSSEKRAAVCASSVINLWSSSTAKRCRAGGASPSNPHDPLADTLLSRPVHAEDIAELKNGKRSCRPQAPSRRCCQANDSELSGVIQCCQLQQSLGVVPHQQPCVSQMCSRNCFVSRNLSILVVRVSSVQRRHGIRCATAKAASA